MTKKPPVNYQNLFEALPGRYVAFLADDPVFTIAAENKAHAAVAQVNPEEVIGRPLFDVWPDVSEKYKKTGVSDLVESLRTVIRTGEPDTMPTLHYDIPAPDGSFMERYWQVTHYPVFDETGKVVMVYQNTEDITDEITAGSKLQRAEQQLEEALSSGLIGTWMWNIDQDVVVGDRYMANMFGISQEAAAEGLQLKEFTARIYPDDRDRVQQEITEALKSSDTFSTEYRTGGDGQTLHWINARGRIERDEDGKPIHFPGVLIDITDRKQTELNLSFLAKAGVLLGKSLEYKKTLQSICELAVPDIADWCTVHMLDESGELRPVAVAHKDTEKTQWALDLQKTQKPPNLEEKSGLPQVLRTGKPELYPEITEEMIQASAKSKDEAKLLHSLGMSSVIMVPLTVDGENIGGITLISAEQKRHYSTNDLEMALTLASRASVAITNAKLFTAAQKEIDLRRKLEEQLRMSNEELELRVQERTDQLETTNKNLERSNQELQDFAYVASHDLQEPLRKIQAFGNLLETEYGDQLGDGKDYLDRMRSAAKRMSALIEDILEFSRVTTKARGFQPVDLTVVAREVLEDLETRIEDTGATVVLDKLPKIDADAMQIRQLLQNLIGNALKFHMEGRPPVVKIHAEVDISQPKQTRLITLSIEDNGVGFDEKYRDRIFAVFQRLHTRESYEGTGIGLAVCRKIVERHGGTISASSHPGKGATFTVTLPVHHKKGEVYDD